MYFYRLGFGIEGAALATGIGQLIPAVVGLFYFFFVKEIFILQISFSWKCPFRCKF